MVDKTPKSGRGNQRVLEFAFDNYREGMATQFLKRIQEVFNPEYIKVSVKAVNRFTNLWDLYEHLLTIHDWTYAFSDDHRVWLSGEAAIGRLKLLRNQLSYEDKTKADSLWKQYAK